MKKLLVMWMAIGLGTLTAAAGSGVGVFGSYGDTDDLGPGFGGDSTWVPRKWFTTATSEGAARMRTSPAQAASAAR